MKVLITGGGGFLGTAVVAALREAGHEATSFSRSRYPHVDALGASQIQGDLCDAQAVAAALEGMDAVIHSAAKPPPWGPPEDYEAINVGGTQNVIDGCRAAGIRHLVYTSTPSVVTADGSIEGGDESLPYGTHFFGADYPRTKAEAERRVLAADDDALHTVALRPHMIWGPGDPHFLPRFVERRRTGKLARIGGDDPTVDTVYVDNAARAHLLALEKLAAGAEVHGKAYFITNDERIGLWTMVDRMLVAAGEEPVDKQVPLGVARPAAWLVEGLWRTFGLAGEPRLTRFLVHQVSSPHWFDIGAARRDLGYVPEVSTEEGLRRLAASLASSPEA